MAYRNREEEKLERREEQRKADAPGAEPGGEKPKRSWKEIDAKRDGARSSSSGNRGERRDKPESASYRNYKSRLDKLFDGDIKLPSSMTASAPVSSDWAKASVPAAAPVVAPAAATTPKEQLKLAQAAVDIEKAARACLKLGDLPLDPESLGKVLSLDDAGLQLAALEGLLEALEKGRPRNAKALVERLNVIVGSLTDPHALDLATGLKARLGG